MGSLLYTVTLQGFIIILSHCLLARGASKGDGVYHNRLQAKSDRRKSRDPGEGTCLRGGGSSHPN